MFLTSYALSDMIFLHLNSKELVNREHVMKADETCVFWEKKLAENQRILAMLDSGQFKAGDGSVIDEQTLGEVRTWALRRVAECEARISERIT